MDKLPTVKKDAEDFLKPTQRRPWRRTLASLAAAVGASFALASTPTSALASAQTPVVGQEMRGSKRSIPKLVLRSATRLLRFAQHDSHESHESHASHESPTTPDNRSDATHADGENVAARRESGDGRPLSAMIEEDALTLLVDESVYSREALLRTCYGSPTVATCSYHAPGRMFFRCGYVPKRAELTSEQYLASLSTPARCFRKSGARFPLWESERSCQVELPRRFAYQSIAAQ